MVAGDCFQRPPKVNDGSRLSGKSRLRSAGLQNTFERIEIAMILMISSVLFFPALDSDFAATKPMHSGPGKVHHPQASGVDGALENIQLAQSQSQALDCDNTTISWRAPVRSKDFVKEHLGLPVTSEISNERMQLEPSNASQECLYTLVGTIHTSDGNEPAVIKTYAATVRYVHAEDSWLPVKIVGGAP
ncbi:MAG: hypothetical protein FJX25_18290 [Alphaproteobacteria bacterium]|nr:hypothetical protein [Alphaproteobacteria bacterium]